MTRISMLTPLPPTKSGVAVYVSMIAKALAEKAELTLVCDQPSADLDRSLRVITFEEWKLSKRPTDEIAICQLGNNPFHEFAFRWALEHDGCVVVLHDLVLHHLIVESTLARGDADAYASELAENHGSAGEALARGRAAGIHHEIGNFLYPASVEVCRRAKAVIVHTEWSARELRRMGVTTPIVVVGHPTVETSIGRSRESIRSAAGFRGEDEIIAMMGFVTRSKRPDAVFEAFGIAIRSNPNLRLWIVGEPAPDIDLSALARRFAIPNDRWRAEGFAAEELFDEAIVASDRVVNLRYPTAGESSGPLSRTLVIGKATAVSDIAQFSDLPDAIVNKIPVGEGEIAALVEFMTSELDGGTATAQKQWIAEHGSIAQCVEGYFRAARAENDVAHPGQSPGFPLALFPDYTLRMTSHSHAARRTDAAIQVTAMSSLRAREFGGPALQLVAKLFRGDEQVADRWLSLPRDLHAGESTTLDLSFPQSGNRLVMVPMLHGVPQPFETILLDVELP